MALAFLFADQNFISQKLIQNVLKYPKDYLPSRVDTRRLGLVQPWCGVILVKAHDQRTNTEWAHTTTLCISLLHARNVFGDIFDADGVFDSQTMRLGF